MASKDTTEQQSLPFGAIDDAGGKSSGTRRKKKSSSRRKKPGGDGEQGGEGGGSAEASAPRGEQEGGKRRRTRKSSGEGKQGGAKEGSSGGAKQAAGEGGAASGGGEQQGQQGQGKRRRSRNRNRNRKKRQQQGQDGQQPAEAQGGGTQKGGEHKGGGQQGGAEKTGGGLYVTDKGGTGVLRRIEDQWCSSKNEIYVPKRLAQKHKLQEGALVEGKLSRGQKHKYQIHEITSIDGKPPGQLPRITFFKNLTSIDPDFHYAVGDSTDNVSMRIVDLLCPIGRGQRGLIVAPPRSGKTTLMREFAHGIETTYPDVNLMVLLIDERPEEATEWRRSVDKGQVFVSTADETAKHHIQLAEAVWKRCMRLVELGEDVVLLLDSITRLARAYNNQAGAGGRTMSGGLDSRAMERPRKIFGSARNTEKAGSLTILGTTLVDTGSRLDQLVFEEFKGTGNMELVLSRKLADRRVFPAIDVERSGTRKEEKLVGMRRLRLIHVLRRVLSRMNFVEAMELLITRLSEVEKTDDFLKRFEVDPEA